MKIIIIEDDSLTALFIQETLEDLGHTVLGSFDNGATLFETISDLDVDLAFMDIEINGKMDGIECAKILQDSYNISSIFITSYQNSATINDAMDSSPLGYLIKPVSETEIEAALAVASRNLKDSVKSQTVENKSLDIGEYSYNFENRTLTYKGKLIKLSKNEYKIIHLLSKYYGNVVSSEELIYNIWGEISNKEDALRELLFRLRKKLPDLEIASLSKTGYYLSKI